MCETSTTAGDGSLIFNGLLVESYKIPKAGLVT